MKNFQIQYSNKVLTVTISRPKALNALNMELLEELHDIIQELYQNNDTRGLILTGDGDKAFVAGADIKELALLDQDKALELAKNGQALFKKIEDCPKPIIAAINGFALGGGCELAMACHIRIATDNAKLGQPEINLGIIPGYAGTQRLARIIGKGRALELMLTGDQIPAQEALRLGLVNRVVPAADLMTEAKKLAVALAAKAPIAIRYILEAVNKGLEMPFAQAQIFEATLFGLVASTDDMREGTAAFLEKRKPAFKGR